MRIRVLHTESFRLAAIYTGIFLVSVAGLGAFLLVITDRAFRDQIVQFSRADIASIQAGYASEGIPEAEEVIAQRMAAPATSDFFLLQREGARLAGNLPPMPPRLGVVELPSTRGAGHAVLGVGMELAPELYVFSGSDLFRAYVVRQRIWHLLFWLFGSALLLASLGGALVSRSFLARTDAITRACRAIMDGNLKTRIPVRGTRDEIDRLSETINLMLDRIAGLMENLRQVTNDIAHDLRTPVSHLRHRLERARAESATKGDYDQALESTIAAADNILALFAALLRIAQIEGGARRANFTAVELAGLLQKLRDIYGPVSEDAGQVLTVDTPVPATVSGDRDLLVQLFSNLIENAIMHTPRGTRIAVTLVKDDAGASVRISDDGPGVPRSELEKLFRRLYRLEASRTKPGYGLGLALVSAIADLHGARLRPESDTGQGFAIEIAFPAVS